jgi:hypothetical protein
MPPAARIRVKSYSKYRKQEVDTKGLSQAHKLFSYPSFNVASWGQFYSDILYINDLNSALELFKVMLADDTVYLASISNLNNLMQFVNSVCC